jgi:hypothetical protein
MWITEALQIISPQVSVKGFKKCCISKGMDETDDMLWNGSEGDGSLRKIKALTVKMGTVTLNSKGR